MGGSPAPAPVAAPIVNVPPPAPVDDDDFEAEDRAEAARKEQQQQQQEQEAREREEQQQREREEAEREQNERAERERNEKADRERQQREKADREKKERADRERREKEQREKEQREREQREKEQREREQREKEQQQQSAVTTNADGRQTWGDWEEMWDESSQCFYYDNLLTGVTSWDKPDGWPHGDVPPPDMAPLEPTRPPSPQTTPAQAPAKDLGVCECGVPYHSELVAFCTECGIPKKPKEAPKEPTKPVAAPKAPAKVEKFAPKAPVKREEEAPIKVFCPECGTPFEGPQERFCSECGTPQPAGKGKVPGKVQLPSAPKSPEPAPRPPPGKKIPVSHSTLSNLDGALAAGLGGQAKNLDLSRVGDWQANQFAGAGGRPASPAANNYSSPSPPPASADSNSQAPEGKTTPIHSTLKSSIANTKKAGMLNKCPAAKKGDILRSGWKPRYFALQADTRFLSYWAGGGAYGAPTGTINLRQAECTVTDKAPNAFRLVENGRKYFYIQASTPESRDDWVASINAVIRPAGG